ncbi:MAG TPA: ABC transporter permease, partial [Candidatus Saccharimonadales bacterium]|nr:ABC transporter permease [Candidatus Saccharimonadales bacterium]
LLCLLFVVPLTIMVVYSFLEPGLYGGVVWAFYPYNYGRILGWPLGAFEEFDPIYIRIFLRSLRFALLTVIVSLIVCYPVAFWVSRLSGMKKNFVLFLITLPFFANLLIRIYAWLLILRPTGFFNHALMALGAVSAPIQLIFNDTAVIIGLVYVLIPFMFLPLYASVERLDTALLKASQDLGASPFQTFRRIIVPLTLPGIAAGSIIVFIPALGNFIVAELLGGAKVLMSGNLIEQQFLSARNWPFGAALAMLVMAVVLVLMLVYVTQVARRGGVAREVEI